ncbi:hypothetical protein HPB50_028851 [Hyalomma asiaticum]|nr:hypothetical protein HPB50_028851 [Hyalomma asiaticum]
MAPTQAEQSSQRRVNWYVSTTEALIRLWEDNLSALRSNSRNARIYEEMARDLNARLPAGEVPFTTKQVRQKLENLNKRYRKLRRCGTTTGSKGVDWPYYWLLHSFLGTLPVNDSSLVEESVEVPEVNEAPEGAEVLAVGDEAQTDYDTAAMEEASTASSQDGSNAAANCSSSAESESQPDANNSSTKRKRKRPATGLQELLELHRQAEERSAGLASQSMELQKELLQLQKEANETQKEMFGFLKSYFDSQNKS